MLDVPHNKGTIIFGDGFGGGIQRTERGDKYEGEFDTGFAHGMGQYTSTSKGKIYRGEYKIGQRHGCGVEYDINPLLKKIEAGADPESAWKEVRPTIEAKAKYGTWLRDTFYSGPDDSGRWCHIKEITGTLQEVKEVLARVRMFQNKPDGEVTFRFKQDASGLPAPVMQDPLHYPHGTGFLAPGPMGQCYPLPKDPKLLEAMKLAAANHQRIYDSYNIPYQTEPGSVMEKAEKLWRRKQARKQRTLQKKLQREAQRIRRMEGAMGKKERETETIVEPGVADENQSLPTNEVDDDDLIASVPQDESDSRNSNMPPSIFASVSITLGSAMHKLQTAMHRAAIVAPPRRSLTRPKQI